MSGNSYLSEQHWPKVWQATQQLVPFLGYICNLVYFPFVGTQCCYRNFNTNVTIHQKISFLDMVKGHERAGSRATIALKGPGLWSGVQVQVIEPGMEVWRGPIPHITKNPVGSRSAGQGDTPSRVSVNS